MSKITIIEGNSNDKDNVRTYMVKGEPGDSPTANVTKEGDTATITITDYNGTTTASVTDGTDGVSPSASVSKVGKVTTLTVTDGSGTTTSTINDGEDGATYEVPTNSVIGFDGNTVPGGYEEVYSDGTYEVTDIPTHTGTGTNIIHLEKAGKIVNIVCNVILLDSISANTWTLLGKIPSALIPSFELATACVIQNAQAGSIVGVGRVLVASDTGIYVKSEVTVTQKTGITFSISWVLS